MTTGSTIFDVPHFYKNCKKICIQSERFTVGGYDWVAEFYPQGIDESVPDGKRSLSVRVLEATEEVWVTCSFELWSFSMSKWDNLIILNVFIIHFTAIR